jgi:hypothetical protein
VLVLLSRPNGRFIRCRSGKARWTTNKGEKDVQICFQSVDADNGHAAAVPGPKINWFRLIRSHSITSSARSSNAGGTMRPSAFAVLTLTVSSNLVGYSNGSSLTLSPRKMC